MFPLILNLEIQNLMWYNIHHHHPGTYYTWSPLNSKYIWRALIESHMILMRKRAKTTADFSENPQKPFLSIAGQIMLSNSCKQVYKYIIKYTT